MSPTSGNSEAGGFGSLGLIDQLAAAVSALGYEEPTPVQRETIPLMLAKRDVLGQAATGTGKTAAFALPMLQRLVGDDAAAKKQTGGLVLVPTRELAMQVSEAIHKYAKGLGVTVLPVYGGAPISQQIRTLERGAGIVVATPGRALDHIKRGTLKLVNLRMLVLDEADEMLDMGFAEDLEALLDATPKGRQTALFSATIPPRIAALSAKYLRDPVRVAIAIEKLPAGELPKVRQVAYVVARAFKLAALGRVLDMEGPSSALVFCRTRNEVDELTETLKLRGYGAEALHGGLSQDQRDRVMKRFRSGATNLLVATDVAARGLDIDHLSHVVNFDVPAAAEAYVHRIGRTGRAGREGVAITLLEPREQRMLRAIEGLTRQRIQVAEVPTVADLRARRLELTRAQLSDAIKAGGLDGVRSVVASLAAEFDLNDVAAAALKLIHATRGGAGDEMEIPAFRPPVPKRGPDRLAPKAPDRVAPRAPDRVAPRAPDKVAHKAPDKVAHKAPDKVAQKTPDKVSHKTPDKVIHKTPDKVAHKTLDKVAHKTPDKVAHKERFAAGATGQQSERPSARKPAWEVARLWIGVGRQAGIRPADLVGAITNEAGVEGWAIGAIQIDIRHSVVEVPAEIAGDIIAALQASTIKGRKIAVRRERDPGRTD